MGIVALGGLFLLLVLGSAKKAPASMDVEDKPLRPGEGDDALIKKVINRQMSALPGLLKSPLNEVTDAAWNKFIAWCRQGALATITPGYNLGYYLINPRQLADFGYMRNVRKVKWQGKDVYNGEWVPPNTEAKFLSDAALQYEVLQKILLNHAKAIGARYKQALNTTIASAAGDTGKPYEKLPITLSGLLGIAKSAGLGGLDKWLASPEDRKKFAQTTQAFVESNGIF